MNDLLVARIAKRCGPFGFRPKIIAAHLACRPTGAAEGRRILSVSRLQNRQRSFRTALASPVVACFAKASAIVKGCSPARGAKACARSYARQEFQELDRSFAQLSRASFCLRARNPRFAVRNETFRLRPLKPLESLKALNQRFRGFLCYQRLGTSFVSPCSREPFAGCFHPP